MKYIFIISCAIILCISSNRSKAQSAINFLCIADTTGTAHCQIPSTVYFSVKIGYPSELMDSSIAINIFWGDGTDTTFVSILPDPPSTFFIFVPHAYTSIGEFYTYGNATLLNGITDTVHSTNPTVISNSCVHLSGNVYLDENQNCLYDGGDIPMTYIYPYIDLVSTTDTVGHVFVIDGAYSLDVVANQNYTLHLGNVPTGLAAICPGSFDYDFAAGSTDLQIDYALTCAAAEADNQIKDAWVTYALAGDYSYISANVINSNCFPGAGTLTFALDSLHEYISMDDWSSDTIPFSVNGNLVTFNFNNLVNYPIVFNNLYNDYFEALKTLVNPNALPGDSFCIDITITPPDLDPTNNTKHMCGIIGGAFDPNHKRVSPLGKGADASIPPATELTYTVEFQNTGNSPAINVNVLDTLDADLDPSTLQVTGSSHPMVYALNQNMLNFSFQNIMLPDSGSNEAASHGWVSYKIKPKSNTPLKTVINNSASIYFDNNAPVLTNKTKNTIDETTGISSTGGAEKLLAFPNPAREEIHFSLPQDFHGHMEIRNMLGTLVWFQQVASPDFNVSTSSFSSGIYQLVATEGNRNYSVKFAVMK